MQARSINWSSSSSDSDFSTYTAARDSSAPFTSNEGFSVVAPMKVNSPLRHTAGTHPAGLVEAMHFVDEQDGAAAGIGAHDLRALDRLADVLHAGSTADSAMNSASKASAISRASVVLPTPGGPHRIIECGFARFEGEPQRLAGAEQMLLADHVIERLRAQRFRRGAWMPCR